MAARKTRYIGPKMRLACCYLASYPDGMRGMWNLSRLAGANGSNSYGYATVMRCMRAGLIRGTQDAAGVWTLWLTDAGREVAAS